MNGEALVDTLRSFIERELLFEGDPPVERDTRLVEEGIIDSMSVVALLGFLEETMGARVDPDDVDIRHFATLDSLAAWVETVVPTVRR